MLNKEEFEKELREIIEKYKKDHQPISIAVKDIACRYNVSVHHVYNYIDMYMKEADNSHMDFKDQYTKDRFMGKK